jgi:hypothetical protein
MMLGHPERIEAEIFGGVHLLKPMGIELRVCPIQFGNICVEISGYSDQVAALAVAVYWRYNREIASLNSDSANAMGE